MKQQHHLIDRDQLESLRGLQGLSPRDFNELATKTYVEESLPGRRLFNRGHHDHWVFYLLEGRLRLEGPEGHELLIGGSEAARYPVAPGQPRQVSAVSEGRVRFIRIDANLLEVLSHPVDEESYRLEEYREDDELAKNRLFYALLHDFMADKLELPVLPEVAFRVREAVRDPDCGTDRVARIVQMDPVVSARLIQAVNSPLYGVQTPIRNCRGAVTFLGLETTRHLVTSYTLRQLFRARSPLLKEQMLNLWRHSAVSGAIAYVLAEMTPGLDKDRAMLLGLLHDIGALPVIHYAARYPDLLNDAKALREAIEALRGQVGAMVLRAWGFSDESIGVVLEAESWQRDPADQADYADVILLAQAIEMISSGRGEGIPPLEQLPAYHKVARGSLTPELIEQVVVEAHKEVAETLQLLG